MPLCNINLYGTAVSDLSALRKRRCGILAPPTPWCGPFFLEGSRVERIMLGGTPVANIRPLGKCGKLASLNLSGCKVEDITPLRGLPLKVIHLQGCPVADVNPLAECSELQEIILPV